MSEAKATDREARRARIRELFPELEQIGRADWREAVTDIWVDVWNDSPWNDPADCPKHATHVQDVPNVTHTRSVTQLALAAAERVEQLHGVRIDRDVLVAGALLHDVSKLLESEHGPEGPRPSRTGRLLQHAVLGAGRAAAYGLPDEVLHIVVGHTHQSANVPATHEAILVHYVDFLDSDVLLLERGERLFAKR